MLKTNLTFHINKPIDVVFDHLTDMQKFASIHPVISKIDRIEESRYLVHETLKLGFIPISFTYPVTIKQNLDTRQIQMIATVMQMTKTTMNFNLLSDNGRTIINEDIIFKSSLPIHSTMAKIFRKQHTLLFKNMDALK